jgi:hypothetical protein
MAEQMRNRGGRRAERNCSLKRVLGPWPVEQRKRNLRLQDERFPRLRVFANCIEQRDARPPQVAGGAQRFDLG